MDTKKWPVIGQILLGSGCFIYFGMVGNGLMEQNYVDFLFGVGGFLLYWFVYKFNPMALKVLTGFLCSLLLWTLYSMLTFKKDPAVDYSVAYFWGFATLAMYGFSIYYFNSSKIKGLFSSEAG